MLSFNRLVLGAVTTAIYLTTAVAIAQMESGHELFDGSPMAAAAADCGTTWAWANPLPQGHSLLDVVWARDQLVAIGMGGTVLTSPDGVTWTSRASGTRKYLNGVTWTGTQLVAVGESGTILTSPNGMIWTARSSGITTRLIRITWTGALLVAVGESGRILTSPDGIAWTPQTSGTSEYLIGITWNNAQLVAVGNLGTILTSPTGLSWTARTAGTDYSLRGITWTGTQFVAVSYNIVLTSPDGVSWTTHDTASHLLLVGITWTGTQLAAVSDGGTVLTSPDGVSWTRYRSDASGLYGITWTGSQLVAVGYSGAILTSADGVSWTTQSSGNVGSLKGMIWTGTQFVVVGNGGTILTSPDGVTWTTRVAAPSSWSEYWGVAWTGTQLVAVGSDGEIQTSPDGVIWTSRTSGTTGTLYGITWTGTQLVAVESHVDSRVLTSPDGVTWTSRAAGTGHALYDIEWTGSQLVAVGYGDTILTSTDGVTWTSRSSGFNANWRFIRWTGTQLVVVGSIGGSGKILTSPDGVTWTQRFSDAVDFLGGITWADTQVVAVGGRGTILTSPDGVTWTTRTSGTTNDLLDVAWDGRQLVAVGSGGTILRSVCTAVPTATLAIGAAVGDLGANACVDLSLSYDGAPNIASLTTDITYDPSKLIPSGATTPVPGRVAQANVVSPGVYRVIVYGGASAMPAGTVASACFTVGGGLQQGTTPLCHASGTPTASDANAGAVPMAGTCGSVTGALPSSRKLDFGTPTSSVAAGYTRATPAAYDAALGYGWTAGTIDSRDHAIGGDLTRDFNFTPDGTFAVSVANGTYNVTLTMGNPRFAHDLMEVYLEGSKLATVSTAANEFAVRTFAVLVGDGQLTLRLKDGGGSDANAIVNALEFGPCTSPVITAQPTSTTIGAGQTASLTVAATGGAPLAYQWYRGSAGVTSDPVGTNANTFTTAALTTTTSFWVRVSNACGSVDSGIATITVQPVSSRVVRVPAGLSASVGGTVAVPVELASQGDENALGFSLTFDAAVLSNPQAVLGSGAPSGSLNTNAAQAGAGKLGIALALPSGQTFTVGTRQLVVVTFSVSAGTGANSTDIAFGDQPIAREVSTAAAATLPATWTGAAVAVTRGYEADVAPRPNGNGTVTTTDWVQVGRFAAGLDTAAAGSELQRADCAPRATLGDGRVSATDWVQAGRYASGLDPLTPAGGPTAGGAVSNLRAGPTGSGRAQMSAMARRLRLQAMERGRDDIEVIVTLDAKGGENALTFSLQFDPLALRFSGAQAGRDASAASLTVNVNEASEGRLGVALALPPGEQFIGDGTEALVLSFIPVGSLDTATPAITFNPSGLVVPELSSVDGDELPMWLDDTTTKTRPPRDRVGSTDRGEEPR